MHESTTDFKKARERHLAGRQHHGTPAAARIIRQGARVVKGAAMIPALSVV